MESNHPKKENDLEIDSFGGRQVNHPNKKSQQQAVGIGIEGWSKIYGFTRGFFSDSDRFEVTQDFFIRSKLKHQKHTMKKQNLSSQKFLVQFWKKNFLNLHFAAFLFCLGICPIYAMLPFQRFPPSFSFVSSSQPLLAAPTGGRGPERTSKGDQSSYQLTTRTLMKFQEPIFKKKTGNFRIRKLQKISTRFGNYWT